MVEVGCTGLVPFWAGGWSTAGWLAWHALASSFGRRAVEFDARSAALPRFGPLAVIIDPAAGHVPDALLQWRGEGDAMP